MSQISVLEFFNLWDEFAQDLERSTIVVSHTMNGKDLSVRKLESRHDILVNDKQISILERLESYREHLGESTYKSTVEVTGAFELPTGDTTMLTIKEGDFFMISGLGIRKEMDFNRKMQSIDFYVDIYSIQHLATGRFKLNDVFIGSLFADVIQHLDRKVKAEMIGSGASNLDERYENAGEWA